MMSLGLFTNDPELKRKLKSAILYKSTSPPQTTWGWLTSFFYNTPTNTTRYLYISAQNYFKCVTIGDLGIGKTTLIKYITFGIRQPTVTTIAAPTIKKIPIKSTTDESPNHVILDFWDTAGQERYSWKMASIYYRYASIVFLTYSVDNYKSFESIVSKYTQIYEHFPWNCIYVLLGTKSDLKSEVPENEAQEFAKKHNIRHFLCSAHTGTNINNMVAIVGQTAFDAQFSNDYDRKKYIGDVQVGAHWRQ